MWGEGPKWAIKSCLVVCINVDAVLHRCGKLTLLVAGIWFLYECAVNQGQHSTLLQEQFILVRGGNQLKVSTPRSTSAPEVKSVLTLRRCSFPPELRVQTRKCLVKRKHCRSPSFFRESEPRRTLLSLPRSTDGSWVREPEEGGAQHFITLKLSSNRVSVNHLKWHNKTKKSNISDLLYSAHWNVMCAPEI